MKTNKTVVATAFMSILILVTAVCATSLQAVKPSSPSTPDAALNAAALKQDRRLNHTVECDFEEMRLDDALEAFTLQTGLNLTVIYGLSSRKISSICRSKPLGSWMTSLARVLDVSWRKVGDGYELFQTNAQLLTVNRNKRKSELNEQAFLKTQGDLLHRQIVEALFHNGSRHNAFADYLSGFNLEAIDVGIPSALEDEPIISATNQSHFLNHIFAVKPFASLSPVQQKAVTQLARECGYTHLASDSPVGYIAAAGSLRLGILESDGRDVWVAPNHEIGQVSGISEQARQNDFDASVKALMRGDSICDLRQLPQHLRSKKLPTDKFKEDGRLYTIVKNITDPVNVDFISDCYLNSSHSNYPSLFTGGRQWTTEAAIRQVAKTFAHRTVYHESFLELSTIVPGLDARMEPPVAAMNSLDAQAKAGRTPTQAELLMMGSCTREQLQLLALRHPVIRKTKTGHILMALRSYPFLRFYTSLTQKQQQQAFLENGLNLLSITAHQRRVLDEVMSIGSARITPSMYKLQRNRFYVRPYMLVYKDFHRDAIKFILTTPEVVSHCRITNL